MLCHQNVHVISANLRDGAFCGPAECYFRVWHVLEFAVSRDQKSGNSGRKWRGGPLPLKCTILYDPLATLAIYTIVYISLPEIGAPGIPDKSRGKIPTRKMELQSAPMHYPVFFP